MEGSHGKLVQGCGGKKIVVTLLGSTLLVAVVICIAVGLTEHGDHRDGNTKPMWKSTSNAVKYACSSTLYPEFCASSLENFPALTRQAGPMDILRAAVTLGSTAVKRASTHTKTLVIPGLSFRQKLALHDCAELFDDTLAELNTTLSDLHNMTFLSVPNHAATLQTLLSAAITNQYTCFEGIELCKGNLSENVNGGLNKVKHLVSNSLAMLKNISDEASLTTSEKGASGSGSGTRRLLSDEEGFPSWMSAGDRRLLQASVARITVNAIVAKDRSGHYFTISAAVKAAPEKSKSRYVIHIRKGVYRENVQIHKNKMNLMFIGDGKHLTIVTGNRNVRDGYTTFHSATVAVTGNGFMARDMMFENTAGSSKHQAVALRVGSDLSVFYRCRFKGYQDTLYVHSLRQFYRECDVYGTVDFIFGNAAVVLQKCNLFARKPMEKQHILYTAQGREDPNQNTGIVVHDCTLTADADFVPVKKSFRVYLGRPWKEYSRTVIMQSYLNDIIHPAGWLEWNGNFALRTLYYGEYMNRGPGAGTSNRVKWPGHRVITRSAEASQFSVGRFIQGNSWLPSTGVKYDANLV